MSDSKMPVTAQNSTNYFLEEKGVEAKKKAEVLGKSEPERKSAERSRKRHPDVTRYGDWEKNGRCLDF